MRTELRSEPFDPWRLVSDYHGRREWPEGQRCGATDLFIGWMRDCHQSGSEAEEPVLSMFLEHYSPMTELALAELVERAIADHGLLDCMLVHRVGTILPGEAIVVVAAWAMHRKAAFEACRGLMEELKSTVPLWKRETTATGSRWVEHNTPGY